MLYKIVSDNFFLSFTVFEIFKPQTMKKGWMEKIKIEIASNFFNEAFDVKIVIIASAFEC